MHRWPDLRPAAQGQIWHAAVDIHTQIASPDAAIAPALCWLVLRKASSSVHIPRSLVAAHGDIDDAEVASY